MPNRFLDRTHLYIDKLRYEQEKKTTTYTKEFEEFTRKTRGHSDLTVAQKWDTHLVLSAFAKLCRKEHEKLRGEYSHLILGDDKAFVKAFNTVCERFGLEREG